MRSSGQLVPEVPERVPPLEREHAPGRVARSSSRRPVTLLNGELLSPRDVWRARSPSSMRAAFATRRAARRSPRLRESLPSAPPAPPTCDVCSILYSSADDWNWGYFVRASIGIGQLTDEDTPGACPADTNSFRNESKSNWRRTPTCRLLPFHRAGGEARDEAVDEEVVEKGDGDAGDEAGAHQ